jgi:hypothetical protein
MSAVDDDLTVSYYAHLYTLDTRGGYTGSRSALTFDTEKETLNHRQGSIHS